MEFTTKNGNTVLLRKPRREDLDGLLTLINSMVREEAPINRTTEFTRNEEIEFLTRRLASIDNGEIIQLVAEINGKIVGNAEIVKLKGRESHVGKLGIGVSSQHRRRGIATMLIKTLVLKAKKHGLKIILLAVYENNLPAITLYKKLGFKEIGRTPRGVLWKEDYIDDIRMAKNIA